MDASTHVPALITPINVARLGSDSINEPFHTNANGTAATACKRNEVHRRFAQSHNILAAWLAAIRAAMDVQSNLLKWILSGKVGAGARARGNIQFDIFD
jgi:hypothetical protein